MSLQHPAVPSTPTHIGIAAEVRLRQLGVPGSAVIVEAVRDGSSGARATTELHPVGYGGHRMWGETVNSLRHGLMPHGWDAETVDGVDLCLNRIHGTAIIVAAGDAATGGEQYRPQFRYDHPGVIRSIVEGHMDTLFDSPRARPIWEVWFLLHHLTTTSVRAEVSRPSSINSSGLVTEWLERILLPEESFGGSGARRSASGPRESPPVEVAVRRRVV